MTIDDRELRITVYHDGTILSDGTRRLHPDPAKDRYIAVLDFGGSEVIYATGRTHIRAVTNVMAEWREIQATGRNPALGPGTLKRERG